MEPVSDSKTILADVRHYVDAVKSVQNEEKDRENRKCNIKITGLQKIGKDTSELSNLIELLAEPFPDLQFSLIQAKRFTKQTGHRNSHTQQCRR